MYVKGPLNFQKYLFLDKRVCGSFIYNTYNVFIFINSVKQFFLIFMFLIFSFNYGEISILDYRSESKNIAFVHNSLIPLLKKV